MVLVRHLLGGVLRRQRMRRGLTLREVSLDARVSLGYISEVERGQKEASSELLAAICSALEVPLSEVLREVSDEIDKIETRMLAPAERPAIGKVTSKRIETHRIDTNRLDGARVDNAMDGTRREVVAAA
ncbi:helix-turn-helix domain-containing protein [Actinopolymorpha alba]|uniref:helix-turn-helix domain-containing protein n=1 Tax=Actinopolymorpha alba TaxID=533267 RepID=UPI0003818653